MRTTVNTTDFSPWPARLCQALVLGGLGLTSALASEPDIERTQLALLLRQLDALELQTERGAALPQQRSTRYHFDYPRLLDDLRRVRSGIQDYLTPQRAQPRDPTPMLGDYRDEQEPSP